MKNLEREGLGDGENYKFPPGAEQADRERGKEEELSAVERLDFNRQTIADLEGSNDIDNEDRDQIEALKKENLELILSDSELAKKEVERLLSDMNEFDSSSQERRKAREEFTLLFERAEENSNVLKSITDQVGDKLLEIARLEREIRQKRLDVAIAEDPSKYPPGTKYPVTKTESFYDVGAVVSYMEKGNPEIANDHIKFLFDAVTEDLSGKSEREIRSILMPVDTYRAVGSGLGCIYKRIVEGGDIPAGTKESLAKLIPILEASDQVGDQDTSRFFSDDSWIKRWLSYNARTTANKERAKKDISNIRKRLAEIKGK